MGLSKAKRIFKKEKIQHVNREEKNGAENGSKVSAFRNKISNSDQIHM